MKLLIILACASLFFTLQAIYWLFVSRKATKQAAVVERLGTDDTFSQGEGLLRRGQDEGALERLLIHRLEQAGEEPNVGAFFGRVIIALLIGFTLGLLVTSELSVGVIIGVVCSVIPYMWLLRKRRKRVAKCEEQLPEALEVMTISLRAGHSLDQTIRLTASELDAPIGEEFKRVAEETALGRPLEEALIALTERLREARTVRTFVTSVLVLRQTGGNLIEVLESIIDTMRQQSQYERKLKAMTAEGRSSSRMLAMLPPGFVGMAYLADQRYIGTLFGDPIGRAMLTASGILYILGVVWVRRLTTPKH